MLRRFSKLLAILGIGLVSNLGFSQERAQQINGEYVLEFFPEKRESKYYFGVNREFRENVGFWVNKYFTKDDLREGIPYADLDTNSNKVITATEILESDFIFGESRESLDGLIIHLKSKLDGASFDKVAHESSMMAVEINSMLKEFDKIRTNKISFESESIK